MKNGIDISEHQGKIDFSKLKGKIDFAMVRCSYGFFHTDKLYKQNINGLQSINVPYGLYHFSYATNEEEAKKEAEGFLNIVKNYRPLYPVALDVEASNLTSNLSKEELVKIVNVFCERLEKAGYYVIIYANLNYFETKLNSSSLKKYDKWVAKWSNKLNYNAGIWQYSSNGKLTGINGRVDLDKSFKDYPKIIKEKKLNNYKEESNLSEINYVVQKGDTLIKIAKKYNLNYRDLAKYNNIKNPNKIYPGQIIKIPSTSIKPNMYIVKKGDTLIKIAKKYNMNWKVIYENNKDVIGSNPNKIYPGMILKI